MKPYEDNHIRIFNKDCRSMSELPDESVQCVVTSPPYWGLRKYADLPDLVWGGDNQCEHEWVSKQVWLVNSSSGTGKQATNKGTLGVQSNRYGKQDFCSLCEAWRGQLGLEPTPELYLQHCIEILREIRRVLRSDGVVFWNIGDSYAGSGSPGGDFRDGKGGDEYLRPYNRKGGVLKPKDLCLIPFRVAIAAQEDGWWVRSIIIWSKNNPMPESVTTRPTESHEYILMLTKSGTPQYWTHRDGGGARQRPKADYRWVNQLTNEEVTVEPADWKGKIPCSDCNGTGKETAVLWGDYEVEIGKCPKCGGKGKVQLWRRINLWRGHDYYFDAEAVREKATRDWRDLGGSLLNKTGWATSAGRHDDTRRNGTNADTTVRNIRSVWEFPTKPYPEAHFAVFPEKLPEICIKSSTPEVGCCSKCGAPWTRVVKKVFTNHDGATQTAYPEGSSAKRLALLRQAARQRGAEYQNIKETIAWQPTCKCNADKVPSVVLDPFLGAGTTLWVARILGRRAVGYELSESYCALSLERNRQLVMELTP